MAKDKTFYQCTQCGYHSPSYLGRCPECQQWNVMAETKVSKTPTVTNPIIQHRQGLPSSSPFEPDGEGTPPSQGIPAWALATGIPTEAIPLRAVDRSHQIRFSSGLSELDRVLGGGFLPGSYILLGGDPGIGKSTLMLQVACTLAHQGKKILYVAGEESPHQIKQRADRLGQGNNDLYIYPDIEVHRLIETIQTLKPDLVVVDSIQAVADGQINSPPGSQSQIKQCAALLMGVAKALNTVIVLVGHVTKEGNLAGPKILEHAVDTVLYFEGEKYKDLRILRTIKNRFGGTQELGVFEMGSDGLREVTNPSELFLSRYDQSPEPGSVVICTMEGSRPLLVEVQALVGYSSYATPRRVATGFEINRLHQILAVLERRLGLSFSHQDIYVNVVGGIDIDEPAADLGVALALISSLRNVIIDPKTVVVGEIGLTGEIRSVRRWKERVSEAEKIGFERLILPAHSEKKRQKKDTSPQSAGIQLAHVSHLMDAIRYCLGNAPLDERPPQSPQWAHSNPSTGKSADSFSPGSQGRSPLKSPLASPTPMSHEDTPF